LLKEQKEAEKLKAVMREEDGLVNVYLWVNRATLDSIGLAGPSLHTSHRNDNPDVAFS
jgi:hypothetical protein